jgi:hypothetical protein
MEFAMSTDDDWQALARQMSEISEQAFHAGWMGELEYRLWEIVNGGHRKYGQMILTDQEVARLRDLAAATRGWVRFNDETQVEEFVGRDDWKRIYDEWALRKSRGGND